MEIFEKLNQAYYLKGTDLLSVTSNNKNGCVALAFDSLEYAIHFIEQQKEALSSRGIDTVNPELVPINESYEFMHLCARHGFAGIVLMSEEDTKEFFFVFVWKRFPLCYPPHLFMMNIVL